MKLDSSWRFGSPGGMPPAAVREFDSLIGKIATQGDRWEILEHFKRYFAGASNGTASLSSSESWAESDLSRMMSRAAENAPLFIESFYDGCQALHSAHGLAVPDHGRMNLILKEYGVGYEIQPPALVAVGMHQPIPRFRQRELRCKFIVHLLILSKRGVSSSFRVGVNFSFRPTLATIQFGSAANFFMAAEASKPRIFARSMNSTTSTRRWPLSRRATND